MFILPEKKRQEELKKENLELIGSYIALNIRDPIICDFVHKCLKNTPLYFWSAYYEKTYSNFPDVYAREGGLVKKTIVAMYYAKQLCSTFCLYDKDVDLAIAATALCDTFVCGLDFNMQYEPFHSVFPRRFFGQCRQWQLSYDNFDTIFRAVERHEGNMAFGSWQTVSGIKPETNIEQVVHLAHYMAGLNKIIFDDFLPKEK